MPGNEPGGQQTPANLEALVAKILKDEESRKKQQEQIDRMESNLRVVGNMLCDKDGNCRVATKEDLARVAEKQGTKSDLSQFTGQQLWDQLKTKPERVRDVEDLHIQKLKKDEAYLKKALEDKEVVGKMVTLLCDPSGENCRLVFNSEIDKAHKAGKIKGQKESWLTKK